MSAQIGEQAPDFTLPSVHEGDISLSQYRGEKYVILSFHVFDFTAGWTTQATSFRQFNSQFEEKNAQVLGISCDQINAHRAWTTALGGLPYPELSDWHPKGKVSQAYDVWNEERGASQRAVLVVDKQGVIRFRETYTPGVLPNPQEILAALEGLG
jgi:alkyl hydroperoxide reductase subunit AhpC